MLDGVHLEAALAAAYALGLLLVAAGVERMAHRSHRRAAAYETGGFTYHAQRDAWECPTGEQLLPVGIDHGRRVAHYRAPAATCNRCPVKNTCTDSADGRVVTRTLDPWLASEIGRFHTGLSLVLVGLAAVLVTIALIRQHAEADVLVLGPMLLVVGLEARRRLMNLEQKARS
jgi:hypothetical protein